MYHVAPVIGTYAYLHYPKDIRINANVLFLLSILHNACLVIFSAWTFYSLSTSMYKYGLVFEPRHYLQHEEIDMAIFYFYISKYYEYVDTFLLHLNGKTPIFLQKFHHVGAVICWHLGYYYKVDSVVFASLLNSLIHTFMYSYYLGSLLKIKQVRSIKPYLTFAQLVQLGQFPVVICFYKNESLANYSVMFIFSCYATILIGLFMHFYWTNYIKNISAKNT
jgi:hypothetical protein